jgi:glycosyltransferase involved in cell wall biosynthesis
MYNAGQFLGDCLKSISEQQKSNFAIETIIIDDHSTDDSFVEARDWCSRQDNAICLKNRGTGIIEALNMGYEQTKGSFISRMDADDIMPPDKLVNLWSPFSNPDISLTTGRVQYFATGKELLDGYIRYEKWLNTLISEHRPFSEIYRECPIASPNWMIRKSTFDKSGAFRSLVYPEDYDLVMRWKNAGIVPHCVNELTHVWRDHQDRTSRTSEHYADNRFIQLKVKWFLKSEIHDGTEIRLHGSGKKARAIAKELLAHGAVFRWYTGNEKKVGNDIYGVQVRYESEIQLEGKFKIILAISSPADIEEILKKYHAAGFGNGVEYFPFF